MTGPEHYHHAEQMLDEAAAALTPEGERYRLKVAQVHATLAHAAAAALAGYSRLPGRDADSWQAAAGTRPEVTQ